MCVLFEIINNPATDNTVNVAESLGGLSMVVSYRMQMIRHDDVGIDEKPADFRASARALQVMTLIASVRNTGRRSLATAVM